MDYDPENDLYTLLGISHSATVHEIRKVHRTRIRTEHPDKATGENRRAAILNHARDVLVDPDARAEYDRARRAYLARLGAAIASARRKTKRTRPEMKRTRPAVARNPGQNSDESPALKKSPATTPADFAIGRVLEHAGRGEWGQAIIWFGLALGSLSERRRGDLR